MHINNINYSQYKLGPYTWKYKSACYTNIKKIYIKKLFDPLLILYVCPDKEVISL